MGPIAINVAHYWAMTFLAAANCALIASRYSAVGSPNYNNARSARAQLLVHSDNWSHTRLQLLRRYAH